MNKLLTLLLVTCMFTANAQYSKQKRHKTKNPFGTGLVIGGLGVLTLSLTTAPIYNYTPANSTYSSNVILTNTSGTYTKQPFLQQGAKAYVIITCATFTVTGLITMLTGN